MKPLTVLLAAILATCAPLAPRPADPTAEMPCDVFEHTMDLPEITPRLRECVAEGNPGAQARLGMAYWEYSLKDQPPSSVDNLEIEQMQAEGRRLLEAASASDIAIAQTELGRAHLLGLFAVEQDYAAAQRLLRAASHNGDSIAPYLLSQMYLVGRGVPQSTEQAEQWLRLSAMRGYEPARHALEWHASMRLIPG